MSIDIHLPLQESSNRIRIFQLSLPNFFPFLFTSFHFFSFLFISFHFVSFRFISFILSFHRLLVDRLNLLVEFHIKHTYSWIPEFILTTIRPVSTKNGILTRNPYHTVMFTQTHPSCGFIFKQFKGKIDDQMIGC